MHVSDLMNSKPTTVTGGVSLGDALDLMQRRRTDHLCVTANGKLVGMLFERDVHTALRGANDVVTGLAMPIWRAMTQNPPTIHPEQILREAMFVFAQRRVACLPVVQGRRLVGLLQRKDCLRELIP